MPSVNVRSEDHWHMLRSENIGGSEIASLFYEVEVPQAEGPPQTEIMSICDPLPDGAQPMACLSPYKTGYRLWMEKAGLLPPAFEENERIDAGNFLEAALAAWAMKKWPETRLRKVTRYMTHPIIGGWGASLDYETVEGLKPVEFKNVDSAIYAAQWAETDGEIDAPPLHIQLQLQAQLGVSERFEGMVVACVGGNQLKRGTFAVHEASQLKIADAIARFWESVRMERPPIAFADIETARDFYRFGVKDRATFLEGEEIDAVCAELVKLELAEKRIRTLRENLGGRLAAAMGSALDGATKARTASHLVSWPVIHRKAQTYKARWQPDLVYRGKLSIKEAGA